MTNYNEHKASNLSNEARAIVAADMWQAYCSVAGCHNYRVPFDYAGVIYCADMSADQIARFVVLDSASRGAGYAIRLNVPKRVRPFLAQTSRVMCSVAYFEEYKQNAIDSGRCKAGTPNGHIFEMMECDRLGIEWAQDNEGFDRRGDIVEDGIDYQYKANYGKGATFANEKRLHGLGVWA